LLCGLSAAVAVIADRTAYYVRIATGRRYLFRYLLFPTELMSHVHFRKLSARHKHNRTSRHF